MEKDYNSGKYSGFFSKKLKAGKRRTYFFDVRSTKKGDFFLTITESKKKFEGDGYDSHKIFLYKEDFKKFLEALNETIDYIKTELMPNYDYDAERPAKESPESNLSEDERPSDNSSKHSPELKPEHKSEETHPDTSPTITTNPTTSAISDDEQIDWN